MGGIGSGRKNRTNTRIVAEHCLSLDINQWNRLGYCQPGTFEAKGAYHIANQPIFVIACQITWTPCNFGGDRPWFVCPNCQSKVGKLYLIKVKASCRKCLNLTYKSSNYSRDIHKTFWRSKVPALMKKLKCFDERFYLTLPSKAKGMHHRTYERLAIKLLEAIQDFRQGISFDMSRYFKYLKKLQGTR